MNSFVKHLLFAGYLVLCVVLGLIITLISTKLCASKRCIQKSNLILRDMNVSVKPCDNFYKFVCGNYKGLNGKEGKLSILEEIKERQTHLIASFLNKPVVKNEDRVLHVIKRIYQSCLDITKIEEEGVQPIIGTLRKIRGFPMVEGKHWNTLITDTAWSLDALEYNERFLGFKGGHIFDSSVERLAKSPDKLYVHIKPPQHLEFNDTYFDAYYTYVKKITSVLCKSDKRYFMPEDKEINDTIQFKSQLSKIERKAFFNCSESYYLEDLEEFSKEFPFLGLKGYLRSMIPYGDMPKTIVVTGVTKSFFNGVKALIDKTDKRIVTNYMIIQNIKEVTMFLPSSFREAHASLLASTDQSSTIAMDRQTACVKCIMKNAGSAVSALYLFGRFESSKQTYLSHIFDSLKTHTKRLVSQIHWMDKKTKKKALAKVNLLDYASPVPDDVYRSLTNRTAFRIYYEDLCFARNASTLESNLVLPQFLSDKQWELMERKSEIFDSNIDIFTSDISLDYERNLVVIPMAFKTYPIFDGLWPKYLNFGGFCSKVAMELIRAIHFSGEIYDSKLKKNDWWSIETKAEHKKYSKCFINQYNDFIKSYTDVQIKDHECVEDMESRLAGVKIAYLAYSTYDQKRFLPERRLYGLKKFTPKHMFFVDFATFYCNVNKHRHHRNFTEMEASVEPSEYKVNGNLRNLRIFSQLFKCSLNSSMNPSAKCDLWNK